MIKRSYRAITALVLWLSPCIFLAMLCNAVYRGECDGGTDCIMLWCLLQAQQSSPLSPPRAFRGQHPMHPMRLPCSTSRSSKVWPGGTTEVKVGSCTLNKCMLGFWCMAGQAVYRGGHACTLQVSAHLTMQ